MATIRAKQADYECIRILKAEGYECIRSAGQDKYANVIAWNNEQIRFIIIKQESHVSNNGYGNLLKALRTYPVPPNARHELWVWNSAVDWRLIVYVNPQQELVYQTKVTFDIKDFPPRRKKRRKTDKKTSGYSL